MASTEMSNLRNVLIVYNPVDGKEWEKYLKSEINTYFRGQIEIISVRDKRVPPSVVERKPSGPDITKMNFGPIKRSAILLVICTPQHRLYMIDNPLISYKQALVVNNLTFLPENSVIYFCNTFPADLLEADSSGSTLENRFEQFSKWHQFNCEDETVNLMKFVDAGFLRIKNEIASKIHPKAKLINSTAKCQESTTIVVVFEQALPDKVIVQAYINHQSLPTEILNPYTVTFLTSEHVEGDANILITVNGNEVDLGQQTISFVSAANDINSVSQIYITLMNKIIDVALTNGTSLSSLDVKLSDTFISEMEHIPVPAFEMLFGVFQAISEETSDYPFPSLLHLAAHYGLKELAGRLFDLPDAKLVLEISNNNDKTPEVLAKERNHEELASYFENLREGELYDLYMKFVQNLYVNDMDDKKLKTEIKILRMKGKTLDTKNPEITSSTPGYLSMNKTDSNKRLSGKSNTSDRRNSKDSNQLQETINGFVGKQMKKEIDLVQTVNQCDGIISKQQGKGSFREKHDMAKKMKAEIEKVKNTFEVIRENKGANGENEEIYYAVNIKPNAGTKRSSNIANRHEHHR